VVIAACRTNTATPHVVEAHVAVEQSVDARRDAPKEGSVLHIPAPFACEVRAITVVQGQHVTRGTRLALLSPLDSWFSPLRRAQAERLAAEHIYARTNALYRLGEVSSKELEDADDRVRSATAEVTRQAALEALVADAGAGLSDEVASRLDLESVRAPVDGIVLAVPTGACTGDLFQLRPDP
jgi:multidrug resistance efflux pump